jgi:beta-lactamase regulating signal transducer with metallopeptidase domain
VNEWLLSNWVFGNTVVATFIAMLAWSVNRFCKRPAIAHVLWILVLVKLMMPPLWVVSMPMGLPYLAGSSESTLNALADGFDRTSLIALAVWATGSFAVMAWIVRASRRVTRIIEQRGRFDITSTRQLARLVDLPHVRTPSVWLIDAIVSPMLVSPLIRHVFWRSEAEVKIIVPKALWRQLDDDSRGVLLMHEWTHLCRRDWIVRLIEVIAMIVFWWHPLFWIAKLQIEDCEESCCDMAAARSQNATPRVYAEALLRTLDFLCEPLERNLREVESRPLASGIGRFPRIEQRLRYILQGDLQVHVGRGGWAIVMAITLVSLLSPSPSWSSLNWSDSRTRADRQERLRLKTPAADEMLSVLSTVEPELSSRRIPASQD